MTRTPTFGWRIHAMPWLTALLASGALLLAAGCSDEPGPERELREVAERLDDAEARVAEAREEVLEHRRAVTESETHLATARQELREAEERLARVETQVDRRATDVALFRLIQSRLLEAEPLREAAVVALVADGSVELRGTVRTVEERDRAIAIVQDVPGVGEVRSRLEVTQATADASQTSAQGG